MPTIDSPTSRLLAIIRQFRSQNRGRSIKEAWEKVFNTAERPEFYRQYAMVLELVALSRSELSRAGGVKPEAYTRKFDKVENVFNHGLGEPLQATDGDCDEATMVALEIGAHRCEELAPQHDYEESALRDLSGSLRLLVEEFRNGTFPEPFKTNITKRLLEVLRAIDDFRYFGIGNVTQKLEAAVGAVSIASASEPEQAAKDLAVSKVKTWLKTTLLALSVIKASVDTAHLLEDHFTRAPSLPEATKKP